MTLTILAAQLGASSFAWGLSCNGPTEGFAGNIPANGWSLETGAPDGPQWTTLTSCQETGNFSNGSGGVACVSSDRFGPAPMDSSLVTPAIDLTGYTEATLSYTANYQNYASSDFLDLDISQDGGLTWTTLLSWKQDQGRFRARPGVDVSLDISAYAGQQGLRLRWRYADPSDGAWNWYAQIDDVALSCVEAPKSPNIKADPQSLNGRQTPDDQTFQDILIINDGIGSLTWQVDSLTPDCVNPAEHEWLSLEPMFGTIAPDSDQILRVGLDSRGLSPGHYEVELCIASNDPDPGPGNETALIRLPIRLEIEPSEPVMIRLTGYPAGSGAVIGSGRYPPRATVEVSARPAPGWAFMYWQVDSAQITDNPYRFEAASDRTLRAIFFQPKGQATGVSSLPAAGLLALIFLLGVLGVRRSRCRRP